MSRDIIGQLKKLKKNPEAGWAPHAVKEQTRARIMEAIHHPAESGDISVHAGIAYYRWVFNHFISKPVVVGAAAFVLILGGWMTSVNAASNSLPGDTLYTLKLATEQARLKLADAEHRAILHTEFAQRRYEEALAISSAPERQAFLETTLDAFKEQIDLANSNLQRLREEGSSETLTVATTVDKKIEELNSVIDGAASQDGTEEGANKVAQAKETTQGASDAVVDVIVGTHEDAQPSVSQEDLDELFRKELTELRSREAFDLGRVAVIQSTVDENAELLALVDFSIDGLEQIELELITAGSSDAEAIRLYADGGYRTAFDILRDANAILLQQENALALIETALINALQEANGLLEAQEVEEQLESESTITNIDSSEGS